MKKIDKIDFFVGVFLSSIINSTQVSPSLFDETNESKKVEFETNRGKFNIYIKYTTITKHGRKNKKGQRRTYWDIAFTENDLNKLRTFGKPGSTNYVSIICTNKEMSDTRIVILEIEKVLSYLENAPAGKQKRISIFRYGKENKFHYKGTGCDDKEAQETDIDFLTYFE